MKEFESSICFFCGEAHATVKCTNKSCSRSFHVVCGEKNKCLFEFVEPFDSYCHDHHRLSDSHSNKPYKLWTCQTCYEHLGDNEAIDYINSCCDQGWYHRQCIRKQAYFSGDNMKCPSCGEKGEDRRAFQAQVQAQGVFIPKRSALYPLSMAEKKNLPSRNI